MRIGIVGHKTGNDSFGITSAYYNFIDIFGKSVILTPKMDDEELDLLILPGGPDISSHIYGQVPNINNSNPDLFREYFFKTNLQKYIDKETPIFGICLGMQQLNVHFGGTLNQHVPGYYSVPRTETKEKIKVSEKFAQFIGVKTNVDVNSLHHQTLDKVPECLEVIATSVTGNAEMICHKTLPIFGVQWHPEEIFDEISIKTISYLLKQSKK